MSTRASALFILCARWALKGERRAERSDVLAADVQEEEDAYLSHTRSSSTVLISLLWVAAVGSRRAAPGGRRGSRSEHVVDDTDWLLTGDNVFLTVHLQENPRRHEDSMENCTQFPSRV